MGATAAPVCCIHVIEDLSDNLIPLSLKSYLKIRQSIQEWLFLDGKEREISEHLNTLEGFREDGSLEKCDDGQFAYHRKCYMRFTDKTKIERAKKRIPESHPVDENTVVVRPKRCNQTSCDRTGIFPFICVICSREKFVFEKHSSKRKKETLTLCQTFTASTALLNSATKKADERLLCKIQGIDCIAKEVKYHKSCYKTYTKEKPETQQKPPCSTSYSVFCNIVDERIVKNSEILSMDKLSSIFHATFQNLNPTQTVKVCNRQLKRWLQRDFPQIVFVKPKQKNISELVICSLTPNQPVLIEHNFHSTETDTVESEEETTDLRVKSNYDSETKALLYKAALILKTILKDSPVLQCKWPPTAEDLNEASAEKMIPSLLFNFVAWCIGETDEFETDKFVNTSENIKRKLFSVAQDMIYISSAGRKQTPKHLSLAMAVRHITGSARMINILNGFGHCISHSAVLEYDTQLAEMQLNSVGNLPIGIVPRKFATLVWDNIDFCEETVSGHGTTHSTNGIIVQPKVHSDSDAITYLKCDKKSKKRKIDPPVTHIPNYFIGQRCNPEVPEIITNAKGTDKLCEAKRIDAAYIVAKFPEKSKELLPGWTGFNCMLEHENIPNLTTIRYLPVLEANPTEFSTVHAILMNSLDVCEKLGLKEIVLVFDQAIYSKAQQIRWKEEKFKKPLVIRLGEFHISMSFLAVIGKRFKDAGLYNILVESGIVAEGSVNGVLSGKCYNRSIRCHKVLYEAISRLLWTEFLDSIPNEERLHCFEVSLHLHQMYNLKILKRNELPDDFLSILENFNAFVAKNSQSNVTFAFWMSYLDMVGSFLRFLRATRNADWDLHLAAVEEMIPWFFSYDHVNYARYLPVYLLEMLNLPKTHPFVYDELCTGNFVAQRQNSYGFCGIAMDQVIEQTANRDSKTKGGLKGFTRNPAAVHRWMLSHHLRAHICLSCEQLSGKAAEEYIKKDLYPAEIQKFENMVNDVVSTLTSMINPFTWREDVLVNISSGAYASDSVQLDLTQAKDVGKDAFGKFCKERVLEGHSIDIYSPIKQQKLSTFSSTAKKTVSKDQVDQKIFKNSTDLLARIIVMGQSRTLDMKTILSYNLNAFPPAIADIDGSLVKNSKSTLIRGILGLADNDIAINNLPIDSSIILDGMAVLHQIKNVTATFGELAFSLLEYIISVSKKYKCKTAHFVSDTYPTISIKNSERERRSNGSEVVISINSPNQKIPKQFKSFLANGSNKETLINFIYKQWITYDPATFKTVAIYISHGKICHSILPGDENVVVKEVPELFNDHEEADTRLLLHAYYASKTSTAVLIKSVDTDVFILSLAMSNKFPIDIYLVMGTTHSSEVKNISLIAKILGSDFCSALIGLHIFTGCDTCSAFKGKGKIKPLKIMQSNFTYIKMFQNLGSSWELTPSLIKNLEVFVCDLYGYPTVDKINEVRYKIFKLKFRIDVTLPPNFDSLQLHMKRSNYQSNIHRRCLENYISVPSPSEHGWFIKNNNISIQWDTLPIAPDFLQKHISCACLKTACSSKKCTCKLKNSVCSEFCSCESNCQNSNNASDISNCNDDLILRIDDVFNCNDDLMDSDSDSSE